MHGIVLSAGAFFVGGMSTLMSGTFPPDGLGADLLWGALAVSALIAVVGLERPE